MRIDATVESITALEALRDLRFQRTTAARKRTIMAEKSAVSLTRKPVLTSMPATEWWS